MQTGEVGIPEKSGKEALETVLNALKVTLKTIKFKQV